MSMSGGPGNGDPGDPGSLGSLRDRNRGRIIDALRRRGQLSRADIARATGLSRSTVSSLVADLITEGLIDEGAAGSAHGDHGGRPSVLLALNGDAGAVVGIDFGHSHLRVAIGDLTHAVLAEDELPLDVDHEAEEGLAAAAEMVARLLDEAAVPAERVLGIGLGIPGPIDAETGLVGSSAILPGWVGRRADAHLADRFGVPVRIDNDANLGALGEVVWGAGRGCDDVLYVKVSSGIGGGLVLDGRVYRGGGGLAGELGHLSVDESGRMCRCGSRGCLETVASVPVLLRLLRGVHGAELDLARVVTLAEDGDPACQRALADAGSALGAALAGVCNVLNPRRVVVGGDLARAGDLLLDPVRAALRYSGMRAVIDQLEVVQGELGDRAQVLGAMALVLLDPSHPVTLHPIGPRARVRA